MLAHQLGYPLPAKAAYGNLELGKTLEGVRLRPSAVRHGAMTIHSITRENTGNSLPSACEDDSLATAPEFLFLMRGLPVTFC
jgi:hypothetical protein